MSVFNSAYYRAKKKGLSDAEAETSAFKQANCVVKQKANETAIVRRFISNFVVQSLITQSEPLEAFIAGNQGIRPAFSTEPVENSTPSQEKIISSTEGQTSAVACADAYYLADCKGETVALPDKDAVQGAEEAARTAGQELFLISITTIRPGENNP